MACQRVWISGLRVSNRLRQSPESEAARRKARRLRESESPALRRQGAATSVWAGFVADAETVGGRYCEDCHVAEVVTDPHLRGGVRGYALDADRARGLWAVSEGLVGEG